MCQIWSSVEAHKINQILFVRAPQKNLFHKSLWKIFFSWFLYFLLPVWVTTKWTIRGIWNQKNARERYHILLVIYIYKNDFSKAFLLNFHLHDLFQSFSFGLAKKVSFFFSFKLNKIFCIRNLRPNRNI